MKNSSYKLFFDKFFTDTAVVPSLWEMRNKFVSENFCPKRRHCMSRTWRQPPPTPPSSPRLQSPPSHQFSGRPGETQLYQEAPSKWRKYAKSDPLQLFWLKYKYKCKYKYKYKNKYKYKERKPQRQKWTPDPPQFPGMLPTLGSLVINVMTIAILLSVKDVLGLFFFNQHNCS